MQKQEFIKNMKKYGIKVEQDVDLKPYTSLHIGGKASLFFAPKHNVEIQQLIIQTLKHHIPYCIIGNGSNILVRDQGYDGLVIVLAKYFKRIDVVGTQLHTQGGASLKEVCEVAHAHSLSGMEFAYGIPATTGGAAYMNAGAYGGEMKDIVKSCCYIDEFGKINIIDNSEMMFGYRHCVFSDRNVCVLEVVFELKHGNQGEIRAHMDRLMKKRAENQPLESYSAGSTFKRPEGSYASLLISECGLKGYQYGDAQVSEKHAGFLINIANASSAEFLTLIHHVQEEVYQKRGFELECEVKIL